MRKQTRRLAKAVGYRSNFEIVFKTAFEKLGYSAKYEAKTIMYIQPEKPRKYTPDWEVQEGIYIETKGRFPPEERQKVLWVRESNPKIKVYMLFQNSSVTLSKRSKTTYGDWCTKHGIEWADISEVDKWRKWFENPAT